VRKRKTWYGNDVNKSISLFEQGLLVRYVSKEKGWECLYLSGINPNKFSIGWTSEEILEETLTTAWAKKDLDFFLRCSGCTWEEWLAFDMASRISDFTGYFGELNLFGDDYWGGYTVKEICKRLHIKYNEEFEKI
jgi:hypothetical protein